MLYSKANKIGSILITRDTWLLIGIFIFALSLRLIYLLQLKSSPLFGFFAMDSLDYDKAALQILSGKFLFGDAIYLNPLYPFILSAIYMVFGHNLMAVGLLQIFVDALTCLLVYFVGIKTFNKKSLALLASFIYAAYGISIFYTGFLLDTTFSAFFVTSSVLVILYAHEKNKLILWFFSGLIFGLCALLRPNVVLFIPFLIIWNYANKNGGVARKTVNLIFIFMGILIALSPFLIRNYMIEKNISIFGVHGGLNFYIGNHHGAYGGYESAGMSNYPVEMVKESILKASEETGKGLSPSQASAYWFLKGLRFIKNNPLEYVSLMTRKFFLFWNGAEIEANLNFYFCKRFLPILNLPLFYFSFVGPLLMMGMALALRQGRAYSTLVVLFIISYMLSVMLLFMTSRYRLPCIPLIIVMASYALYSFVSLLRTKQIKTAFALTILFVISFIIMNNYPFSLNSSNIESINDHPAAHCNLGASYSQKGMLEEAIAEYKKALERNPDYAEALYNLGNSYYAKGMLKEAIVEYQKAIEANPNYARARHSLGSAYYQNGLVREAVSEYKKTLKINPYCSEAHYNLGIIYNQKGMRKDAIVEYKKALKINPDYAEAYNNLGGIYCERGLVEKAVREYKKALKNNPNYITAYDNLGIAYHNKGMLDESIAQYQKILSINPAYVEARNKLGTLYHEKGLFKKAIPEYLEALKVKPTNAEIHYKAAVCYYNQNDLKQAIYHCDEATANGFKADPQFLELLKPHENTKQ